MRKRGVIRAVVFDWAGTAVDFGSLAPVAAFAAAFERAGVPVSTEEIRAFMGLEKRRHLVSLLEDEAISARWLAARGAAPTDRDVDCLFDEFSNALVEVLPLYAEPIPGLLEAAAQLRERGIKIGSNSGYSAHMMGVLARAAQRHGFQPDCIVSSSDVVAGRPAPDLSLRCLDLLGIAAGAPAIKVDDTRAGIEEGRNAGLWTVAVAISGNEVGLSYAQWRALGSDEQSSLRQRANAALRDCGPDYIIDTVADLPEVVDSIEDRIVSGEQPIAK
jgi:phosphonoacetaldehyde hydrolase